MTSSARRTKSSTRPTFRSRFPSSARFRVNAFNQSRGAAAVFRTIPSLIMSLDDLNAPKIFKDLSMQPRGLVLVTGPTGSGKSTTLAAMINYVNDNKPDHIITIEDPIEFVHESEALPDQPARSAPRHARVQRGAALGAARGSGRRSWSAKCATSRRSGWR